MKDKKFTLERFDRKETFKINGEIVSENTYNIELAKQRKRQINEKRIKDEFTGTRKRI